MLRSYIIQIFTSLIPVLCNAQSATLLPSPSTAEGEPLPGSFVTSDWKNLFTGATITIDGAAVTLPAVSTSAPSVVTLQSNMYTIDKYGNLVVSGIFPQDADEYVVAGMTKSLSRGPHLTTTAPGVHGASNTRINGVEETGAMQSSAKNGETATSLPSSSATANGRGNESGNGSGKTIETSLATKTTELSGRLLLCLATTLFVELIT